MHDRADDFAGRNLSRHWLQVGIGVALQMKSGETAGDALRRGGSSVVGIGAIQRRQGQSEISLAGSGRILVASLWRA